MKKFARTFYCPDFVSLGDEDLIRQGMMNVPGVETLEIDHAAHTVLVTTLAPEGLGTVEASLRDLGFPPEDRVEV